MKKLAAAIIIVIYLPIFALANRLPGIFDSHEILELTITYDIKKMGKDKGEKRSYHPAKLSYIDPLGQKVVSDVLIRSRGKMRRQYLRCLVPPFKIKFDASQTKDTIFSEQKSLKLVVQCNKRPKFYQHYVLQEYMIYRTYNILTDMAYKVRLAKFEFRDIRKKVKPFSGYGFFIENSKKMAERLNGTIAEEHSIKLSNIDFSGSTLVSVFQYMIGNTDWSIRSNHNMKLIRIGDSPKLFPIPYDFDVTGIIDPHYGRPDSRLPIKSVRERLFRGFCKSESQFKRTFAVFKQHKEEIFLLYQKFALFPKDVTKRSIKYLGKFYKIIDNPVLVNRYFINNYRGRPFPR